MQEDNTLCKKQEISPTQRQLEIDLFNKHSQQNNYQTEPFVYLISHDFIDKWKQYVRYDQNSQPKAKTSVQKPVLNEDLVLQDNKVMLSKQKDSIYSVLTISNIQPKVMVASRELMEVFNNYQGERIVRRQKKKQGKWKIQYDLERVKVIVVSKELMKELSGKEIPVLNILLSKEARMQEFKSHLKDWVELYHQKIGIANKSKPTFFNYNLWVIEEDILNQEYEQGYKNIINSNPNHKVFGSKVTSINNVVELEGYVSNKSIIFIIEQIGNLEQKSVICQFCTHSHDQTISCFEFQKQVSSISNQTEPVTSLIPIGLRNIGNTCYINSILQILFHTKYLRQYFFKKEYKKQINEENQLGTFGKLSEIFDKILTEALDQNLTEVDPTQLKKIVGDKNQMFKGYLQQDSQEFLMCLVDLIHQDLKRSSPPKDHLCTQNKGAQSWNKYIQNNNSIITQLFLSQYSSTLHCSNCQKDKVVYDPFFSFSLPLPQKQILIKLVFCAFNRQKLYYKIDLYVESVDIHTIGIKLSKELKEQYHEKKFKFLNWKYGFMDVDKYSQDYLLESFLKKQIICYELSHEDIAAISEENVLKFIVVFRRNNKKKEMPANRPFWFNKQVTTKDIYRRVWQWLFKSTIQNHLDPKFKGVSPVMIFAAHFIKDPPLQLSLILHTQGKGACYYEKPISINTKIFQSIISTLKNMRYQFQINIDKLCQFCDTQMFGKVGSIQNSLKFQSHLQLKECIQKFHLPQYLDDNTTICQNCNKKTGISKSMSLNRIGEYLIVHLKRFKQRIGIRYKNTRFIEFPFQLDISDYIQEQNKDLKYNLYGVVNHSGTLNSGHYTSYVKVQNIWYLFNDHIVSQVKEQDVVTQNAYILFYQKQK